MELPIPITNGRKKIGQLIPAGSSLLDIYKLWWQNVPQKTTFINTIPRELSMFSHIEDCSFPGENASTFNQEGTGVYEVEKKWMSTPGHVGNSV